MRSVVILLPSAGESRRNFWKEAFGSLVVPVTCEDITEIILPVTGQRIHGWLLDYEMIGEEGARRLWETLEKRHTPETVIMTYRALGFPIEGNQDVVHIATSDVETYRRLMLVG